MLVACHWGEDYIPTLYVSAGSGWDFRTKFISSPEGKMQPRRHVRFRLSAPVIFEWKYPPGSQHKSVGVTRDVSARGAFVISRECPPVGTTAYLEMFLPPLHSGAVSLRMCGKGRVRRVEQGAGGESTGGFAVFSTGFALRNREAPLAKQSELCRV
jgi:hypothetical protein